MTTNTELPIRKTDNGKWAITTRETFTNHRFVRTGGDPYTDRRYDTSYFPTRRAAVAYADKLVAAGWTVTTTGLEIDRTR